MPETVKKPPPHHAMSPTHVWDIVVFSVKKTLVCQLPADLLCLYLSTAVWLLACRAESGRVAASVPYIMGLLKSVQVT